MRISAAFALTCVKSRQVFGERFQEACLITVRALDTIHDVNEEEEVQHRADLVDQLCLTFCHLLSLADSKDLNSLNKNLAENYSTDTLENSLRIVALRISPEKASTMIAVKRQLQEKFNDAPKYSDDTDFTNCIITLFSNLENVIF